MDIVAVVKHWHLSAGLTAAAALAGGLDSECSFRHSTGGAVNQFVAREVSQSCSHLNRVEIHIQAVACMKE